MDWSWQTGLQYRRALWAVAAPVMQLQDASHSAPPGPSRSRLSPPPGREGSPPGVQSMCCRMSAVHLAFVQLRISAQTKLWTLMQVQVHIATSHAICFCILVAAFVLKTCRHKHTVVCNSRRAEANHATSAFHCPARSIHTILGMFLSHLPWGGGGGRGRGLSA